MNGDSQQNYIEDAPQHPKETNKENFTIAGILFWIEEEWNKIEVKKIEWELEKAEYQAQIASLQGERRGQENIKKDLILRIKMLEHALKEERKVTETLRKVVDKVKAQGVIIDEIDLTDNKEASNTSEKVNGNKATPQSELNVHQRVEKDALSAQNANVQWKESVQRLKQYLTEIGYNENLLDLRQLRLRHLGVNNGDSNNSRMNKGHPRPQSDNLQESVDAVMQNFDFLNEEDNEDSADNGKFRNSTKQYKKLYESGILSDPKKSITKGALKTGELTDFLASLQSGEGEPTNNPNSQDNYDGFTDSTKNNCSTSNYANNSLDLFGKMNCDRQALGDLATVTVANEAEGNNFQDIGLGGALSSGVGLDHKSNVDSVFGKSMGSGQHYNETGASSGIMGQTGSGTDRRLHWLLRHSLHAHWDVVRCVVFHWSARMLCLLSVGDDGCTLLWSLDQAAGQRNLNGMGGDDCGSDDNVGSDDLQPVRFLRAQHGAGLSAAILPVRSYYGGDEIETIGCVGCLDGTIRCWTLSVDCWMASDDSGSMPGGEDQQSTNDANSSITTGQDCSDAQKTCNSPASFTVKGHTDAVWCLAYDNSAPLKAHPGDESDAAVTNEANSLMEDLNSSTYMASGSSDGNVKLWRVIESKLDVVGETSSCTASRFALSCSRTFSLAKDWSTAPEELPTAMVLLNASQLGHTCLVVGTDLGTLLVVDVSAGSVQSLRLSTQTQLIQSMTAVGSGSVNDQKHQHRIYCMSAHPTRVGLVGAGLECGVVVLFDSRAVALLHCIVAHQQTVTSFAFDPTGLYFATTSHDESLRVWELSSRFCVQEMHAHRNKFNESATAVAFHSKLPMMASAGADSVINVYVAAAANASD